MKIEVIAPQPKVVDLKSQMIPGQWGRGTLMAARQVSAPVPVVAYRRSGAFFLLPENGDEPRLLGPFAPVLTITEILPTGTKLAITL